MLTTVAYQLGPHAPVIYALEVGVGRMWVWFHVGHLRDQWP